MVVWYVGLALLAVLAVYTIQRVVRSRVTAGRQAHRLVRGDARDA